MCADLCLSTDVEIICVVLCTSTSRSLGELMTVFLSVKKDCKAAVGFETEDVVRTVHMTHFSHLGTGGLDYKNKIKKTNKNKMALSWSVPWDPLGVRLVRPF